MISFDPEDLAPVIDAAVERAIAKLARQDAMMMGRLAFTEGEASALIGVARHVLRDERRRGRIKAKLVGKRYMYSAEVLRKYLQP